MYKVPMWVGSHVVNECTKSNILIQFFTYIAFSQYSLARSSSRLCCKSAASGLVL